MEHGAWRVFRVSLRALSTCPLAVCLRVPIPSLQRRFYFLVSCAVLLLWICFFGPLSRSYLVPCFLFILLLQAFHDATR